MARKKVTYLVDEELAKAVKSRAVREAKPDYAVVDEALRAHLGYGIWDELWAQAKLTAEEAERLVGEEVETVRARMHRQRRPTTPRRTRA